MYIQVLIILIVNRYNELDGTRSTREAVSFFVKNKTKHNSILKKDNNNYNYNYDFSKVLFHGKVELKILEIKYESKLVIKMKGVKIEKNA